MIKAYKKTIILTNLVMLAPILVGVILWNRLPAQMPVHFDFNGTVDGWSSRVVAIIVFPLVMLALQWFCIVCTSIDPKGRNIGRKMMIVVLWVVPVISVCTDFACYAVALGYGINISSIIFFMIGIMFVIMGNYMPKSGQSYTMGYKLPWTLDSEENWNRTHRLAGWLWMLGGILFIVGALIQWYWMMLVVIPITLIPVIYSIVLYKKGI